MSFYILETKLPSKIGSHNRFLVQNNADGLGKIVATEFYRGSDSHSRWSQPVDDSYIFGYSQDGEHTLTLEPTIGYIPSFVNHREGSKEVVADFRDVDRQEVEKILKSNG